jgi:hypothetical protein
MEEDPRIVAHAAGGGGPQIDVCGEAIVSSLDICDHHATQVRGSHKYLCHDFLFFHYFAWDYTNVSFYQETLPSVVMMPVEPSTHFDSTSTLSNTSVLELPKSMPAHEDKPWYVDVQN